MSLSLQDKAWIENLVKTTVGGSNVGWLSMEMAELTTGFKRRKLYALADAGLIKMTERKRGLTPQVCEKSLKTYFENNTKKVQRVK